MALADPKKAKCIHVLADGRVLDSIEGYPVRLENSETLVRVFVSVSKKKAQRLARERMADNEQNERTA